MTSSTGPHRAARGAGSLRLAMVAALVGPILALGALATQAHAAAYTVGTTADTPGTCRSTDTTCSLRQAIDAINASPAPPDTITVPAGSYTLAGTALTITADMQIYGAGTPTIAQTVPADRTSAGDRVFNVQVPSGGTAPTVGIQDLAITGGTANDFSGDFGGDIHNGGTLTLTDDTITDGFACSGGGVSNDGGTLTLERSTVTGNHGACGGADSGGIQNHGTPGTPDRPGHLMVDNSTVVANDASLGAGIYSWGDATSTTLVANSTIAGNTTQDETCAGCGGGPARGPGAGLLASDGTIQVQNSIVAKNTESTSSGGPTPTNCSVSGTGAISSLGYNLESATDCKFTAAGDLQSHDPLLVGLGSYGWVTPTDALTPGANGSPAIDRVPASGAGCPTVDQRGISRPQGPLCDIGATEAQTGATTAMSTVEGASAVSTSTATLNGLVSVIGAAPRYHFEYGTNTLYASQVPASDAPVSCDCNSALPVSQAVGGLLPGTIYHVRIVSTNDAGTFYSADQTFLTAGSPPPPPPPPPAGATPNLTTGPPTVASTTSAVFATTVNPNGLPTTARFEYGLGTSYGAATAQQQIGSDRANHTITTAVSGLLPNTIYHVRALASNSAGSVSGNDVVFRTPADPGPPAPVLAKSVNVEPVAGQVFIELPPGALLAAVAPFGGASQPLAPVLKGQGFIPLTEARQIPVGSTLDASAGTVRLTTATASRHRLQFGDFSAGIFKILQPRKQRGLTSLNLIDGQNARLACTSAARAGAAGAPGSGAARAARAARRRLSSKVLALLNGNAHGRFTTSGQYSAATVRGTRWSVSNRCDGTLTRVRRGVVVVRDFRRHRSITVRAGRSYLATAPGA